MVFRMLEGFETKQATTTKLNIAYTRTGTLAFATGRKHGTALNSQTATLLSKELVSPDENTWVVGFAIRKSQVTTIGGSSTAGIELHNAAGAQCSLLLIDAGSGNYKLRLKRGAATIDTTVGAFAWGDRRSWMYFQLKVTVRTGTDGVYELRSYDYLNAATVEFSGVSVNLADQAVDGADRVKVSWFTDSGSFVLIDDIFALDSTGTFNNDFLTPPPTIRGALPNSAGTQTDWTPDSGSNFQNVDDVATATSDTDANSSSVIGDIDLYNYPNFAEINATGTVVYGLQVFSVAAMVASGTRTIKVRVRETTPEATGSNVVLPDLILNAHRQIFDQNPTGTPATWTKASVDAAEFGIEVQA